MTRAAGGRGRRAARLGALRVRHDRRMTRFGASAPEAVLLREVRFHRRRDRRAARARCSAAASPGAPEPAAMKGAGRRSAASPGPAARGRELRRAGSRRAPRGLRRGDEASPRRSTSTAPTTTRTISSSGVDGRPIGTGRIRPMEVAHRARRGAARVSRPRAWDARSCASGARDDPARPAPRSACTPRSTRSDSTRRSVSSPRDRPSTKRRSRTASCSRDLVWKKAVAALIVRDGRLLLGRRAPGALYGRALGPLRRQARAGRGAIRPRSGARAARGALDRGDASRSRSTSASTTTRATGASSAVRSSS